MDATCKSGRVIVVGSLSADYFTYSEHLPQPGETVAGTSFFQDFGGKGANQAVAACHSRNVSSSTYLVACRGSDAIGAAYVERLESCGVDISAVDVAETGVATGTASISVSSATGENAIVIVAGANARLGARHVESALSALKLKTDDVVVCQLEVPREATLRALELARAAGALAVLNPAPARLDMIDDELLKCSDLLVPNEIEVAALAGVRAIDLNDDPTGDLLRTGATEAAKSLVMRGCRAVIVTLGKYGSLAVAPQSLFSDGAASSEFTDEGPIFSYVLVPTAVVKPADTSGAGDCYIGTLAAHLACNGGMTGLKKQDVLIAAMAEASAAASSSVIRPGTQQSYASRTYLATEEHRAVVGQLTRNTTISTSS